MQAVQMLPAFNAFLRGKRKQQLSHWDLALRSHCLHLCCRLELHPPRKEKNSILVYIVCASESGLQAKAGGTHSVSCQPEPPPPLPLLADGVSFLFLALPEVLFFPQQEISCPLKSKGITLLWDEVASKLQKVAKLHSSKGFKGLALLNASLQSPSYKEADLGLTFQLHM
eukprot:1139637-Pelagomonas_calceolata.AAC.1